MTEDEWDELEGEIAEALDNSMDTGWTVDIGAQAVVELLKKTFGYPLTL